MSYVDLIIKYLSGELKAEEASAFEKELESDAGLKKEYELQSAAYKLIREQLRKRDEELFWEKLANAMSHELPGPESRRKWLRPWWYIPLAVACSLAILITLLNPPTPLDVFTRFYDPASDPVILAYNQNTRGESEPGILQYRLGNYERSMDLLSVRIAREGENRKLILYCLLSAIELDRQDEVLEWIRIDGSYGIDPAGQALSWYSGLALLKSGNREAALEMIRPLSQEQGPYWSKARKLEKVLLK
ncbi:MAG: hypothetical protein P1P86_14000 [Bacteroidales bacterium]|nr:hypothetical protein [Bacteroidales bacterium]